MAGAAGRRDLPAWYKEMEKDLECPVCLIAFLDPPIYVCENQHGLCSTCRTKLNEKGKPCPVCNGKLTDKRCLMMEKMLEKLPGTKCIFPECSFKRADRQTVSDHQEDCNHRKTPCGFCGKSMAMSSLNQHLITKHGQNKTVPVMKEPEWVWNLSNFRFVGQSMMRGGPNTPLADVVFYLNAVLLDDNNSMRWVSYNGPKKDRRKYQFSLEVLNDKNTIALSGTKYCVPCDVSSAVVKEQYLGVIINRELAKEVDFSGDLNKPQIKVNVQFFLTR